MHNCNLQIGGSDQMGNITAGISLIHKKMGNKEPAFGLTTKLLTKSDGEKFGKSESGTIWLSSEKTSPFDFFQFWLKTADSDVYDFLKFLSTMSVEDVDVLELEDRNRKPLAQEILAKEITLMVHGQEGLDEAVRITNAMVKDEFKELNEKEVLSVRSGLGNIVIEENEVTLVDALVQTKLAKSKREAREFISNNSIRVNGIRNNDIESVLNKNISLPSNTIFLKRGKRNMASISFK
jgi:tyrosyl-tRNA synthetase